MHGELWIRKGRGSKGNRKEKAACKKHTELQRYDAVSVPYRYRRFGGKVCPTSRLAVLNCPEYGGSNFLGSRWENGTFQTEALLREPPHPSCKLFPASRWCTAGNHFRPTVHCAHEADTCHRNPLCRVTWVLFTADFIIITPPPPIAPTKW
jgi:hypothetical protein